MSERSPIVRRIEIALIAVVIVGAGMASIYYDYIPGTLTVDAQGVVHGSGNKIYPYPDGSPRVVEKYVAGFLRSTRWYRADGKLVVESNWREGTGDFYIVDEDGAILAKIGMVLGVPEGEATFYHHDGTVARRTRFHEGIERVASVSRVTTSSMQAEE